MIRRVLIPEELLLTVTPAVTRYSILNVKDVCFLENKKEPHFTGNVLQKWTVTVVTGMFLLQFLIISYRKVPKVRSKTILNKLDIILGNILFDNIPIQVAHSHLPIPIHLCSPPPPQKNKQKQQPKSEPSFMRHYDFVASDTGLADERTHKIQVT